MAQPSPPPNLPIEPGSPLNGDNLKRAIPALLIICLAAGLIFFRSAEVFIPLFGVLFTAMIFLVVGNHIKQFQRTQSKAPLQPSKTRSIISVVIGIIILFNLISGLIAYLRSQEYYDDYYDEHSSPYGDNYYNDSYYDNSYNHDFSNDYPYKNY